jgi:hypothetical protein
MGRAGNRRRGARVACADRRPTYRRRLVARPRTRRPRRRAAVPVRARALAERGPIGPALRVLPGRHTARRTQASAAGPAKTLDRRADRRRHRELGEDGRDATDTYRLVPRGSRAPHCQHRLPGYRPVAAGARQGWCAEPAWLNEVDPSEENPALDMTCGRTASLHGRKRAKAGATYMLRQTTACRLYEEGPHVNWPSVSSLSSSRVSGRGAALMSLWPPRAGGSGEIGVFARGRKSKQGGQAARRHVAPRGANSPFRVSMCQIA